MFCLANRNWKILNVNSSIVKEEFNTQLIKSLFEKHPLKAVYLIDEKRKLKAVLSKGDFLKSSEKLNWNFSPFYLKRNKSLTDLTLNKSNKYNSIPIVDENDNIVKVIESTDFGGIEVQGKSYINYDNPLVIAEIGNNHNGSIENAKQLIDEAYSSGVDAVKFQARSLQDLYINLSDSYLEKTDFSTAYTVGQLKKYNLNQEELTELFHYAREKNLLVICTPFDIQSAQFLKKEKIDFVKIASADMSNYKLLSEFKDSNIPLIISTGMHKMESINDLSNWLRKNYIEATFLHVNSTYPTPFSDVNLRFMPILEKSSTSGVFGYSGHERGIHIPLAAVSLGAVIIEKHFTLDKELEGNDHKVSLLPVEMKQMVQNIKTLSLALSGGVKKKPITQGEKLNKIALSKGVYAKRPLLKGMQLEENDLIYASPCVGLTTEEANFFMGKTLTKDLEKNDPISKSCFEINQSIKKLKNISNYGIPVRFRDLESIHKEFEPSFLEYHMFSTDLKVDPNEYSKVLKGKKLSVHAPEQFEDGFILDLVSENQMIQLKSLKLFDKILKWTEKVKRITGQSEISLITNVGGATNNENEIYLFNKELAYKKLSAINQTCLKKGVQFLPQTMPPFPWHFGGQGYHRLFVDPQDMIDIQKWTKINFCMDVSHTFMSCSHLNISFYDTLNMVSDHFDYLHIADAIYPGEEGINIGDGEMDFCRLKKYLNTEKYKWIPEVWNGHMDNFSGFKKALKKLDQL
jgi:N-acetylneuraminate synthase